MMAKERFASLTSETDKMITNLRKIISDKNDEIIKIKEAFHYQ